MPSMEIHMAYANTAFCESWTESGGPQANLENNCVCPADIMLTVCSDDFAINKATLSHSTH